jgi:uncharacterized protein (DUF2062 family)
LTFFVADTVVSVVTDTKQLITVILLKKIADTIVAVAGTWVSNPVTLT